MGSVNDKAISGRFNKVWVPGGSHQPVSAQVKSLAAMIQSGQSGGKVVERFVGYWRLAAKIWDDKRKGFGLVFTQLLLTSQCLTF